MAEADTFNLPKYPICSDTEFNRLRSIIVGSAVGANHPDPTDRSFLNFFMTPAYSEISSKVAGPLPKQIIAEVEEDLALLITTLVRFGVEVFRPEAFDSTRSIRSPHWETDQLYTLMPQDNLLVVGETVIEAASPTRSSAFEVLKIGRVGIFQMIHTDSF